MTAHISAPWPETKVTIVLPSPEFDDSRVGEQTVTVLRSMLGRVVTYVRSNPRHTLELPFRLTRQKSLELEAFIRIYYRADWLVVLHNNTEWVGKLVGGTFGRTAVTRIGTGQELIETTLVISARRINA